MHKIMKLCFIALAAVCVLSLAASSVSARVRLELSTTALLAAGRLTFEDSEARRIICDVTLHITALSRLFSKVPGSLVGRVTSILTANPQSPSGTSPLCAGLLTLPMLVLFESISGTLPNPTGGTLLVVGGFQIRLTVFGFITVTCLYLGTIRARANENPARRVRAEGEAIPLFSGSELCERELRNRLTGPMDLTPELTIRLLETR